MNQLGYGHLPKSGQYVNFTQPAHISRGGMCTVDSGAPKLLQVCLLQLHSSISWSFYPSRIHLKSPTKLAGVLEGAKHVASVTR